ncbi:MAG TPA: hypothetical protein VE985_07570 [Gaiellaceae bacterium]|nr:hypothetical protein [Gaiellaceae bacterium]
MTRAILSVGALLAAAIALAGCGGSGSTSGTVSGNAGGNASGTTAGVGGAHRARGSGSFRASVHGFEARLQTSVQALQSGNLSKAIVSGGPLLNDCMGSVDGKIAPHASTQAQKQAVVHLRAACRDMGHAVSAGSSGKMAKAKQLAQAALAQAHTAANLSG